MNKISFKPLSENDFLLLYDWLNRPHVAAKWDGPTTLAEVQERYQSALDSEWIFPHLVLLDKKPIGFIQAYNAELATDGWWESEPPGTWGVDQYIAEEQLLEKGLGSRFIRQFTDELLNRPEVKRVITDPAPDNPRAIRAYEKAGFMGLGVISTPDGPALLMEKLCPTKESPTETPI